MTSVEDPMERASGFAIVGYAARFPGAADADESWQVLREGRDAIPEVPQDRWDADEFFDPDPDAPGKVVTRRAGFVDGVTGFDAPYFGMSAREVRLMDPQHRLLLETAWRAVEHAGTTPYRHKEWRSICTSWSNPQNLLALTMSYRSTRVR
jgi:acyl transferase domain-containing protein